MFNRVFVLDTNKNPLTPCHPARARELLKKGKYTGYVSVRTCGYFKIDSIDGINWKYCKLLQYSDGYQYNLMPNSSHD